MPVTAISAGLAIGKAVYGGIQAHKANKALRELNQTPIQQYSVSPELQNAYSTAQGMSTQGYTGGEQAAYLQNLQQANNTQFQNARNQAGSSLAGAIGAGIQSQNIGALNKFAMSDAELHRQNIDRANQLAGEIQNQNNMAVGANRQYRMAQEQAFGTAANQGVQNVFGGLNQLGFAGQAFALGNQGDPQQAPQMGSNMYSQVINNNPYTGYNPFQAAPQGSYRDENGVLLDINGNIIEE